MEREQVESENNKKNNKENNKDNNKVTKKTTERTEPTTNTRTTETEETRQCYTTLPPHHNHHSRVLYSVATHPQLSGH